MAPPDTTGTVTMHVAKELSFEDVSVHSPGPFRRGDAMRALRENPTGPAFRRALAELDQTADSFRKVLDAAKEKALGGGEADLERIKTNVKRLKFGTVELGTERAFLRAVLESRPLPVRVPTETEDQKRRASELKSLKDQNDAAERRVEADALAVGESAARFMDERDALEARVDALDELEREAEAAELAASGASGAGIADPGDEKLSLEEIRAALEALEAEARAINAALKTRSSEANTLETALEPSERELEALEAEKKLLTGAGNAAERERLDAAAVAETVELIREQKALVESLAGVAVVEAKDDVVRLKITAHVPECPAEALEPVDATLAPPVPAPASEATRELVVTLHPGTRAAADVALEPNTTPIDDIVAVARAAGAAEGALADLCLDVRVRVAATQLRAEALDAAARKTPLEWSRRETQARVGLFGGRGGVAAVDVPFEWPLNGARVRVVGLAGLAPSVVAAAAQKVEPAGYPTLAQAVRATEEALREATAEKKEGGATRSAVEYA